MVDVDRSDDLDGPVAAPGHHTVVNQSRYSEGFDNCQAALSLVGLVPQCCRNRRLKVRPVAVRDVLQNQSWGGVRNGH